MAESYVERWAREKAEAEKAQNKQKEKGKVRKNGKDTGREREKTEEDRP